MNKQKNIYYNILFYYFILFTYAINIVLGRECLGASAPHTRSYGSGFSVYYVIASDMCIRYGRERRKRYEKDIRIYINGAPRFNSMGAPVHLYG